jgi:tight adherence protein B
LTDSISLSKFANLLRSGLSVDRALKSRGAIPKSKGVKFLLEVAKDSGAAVAGELDSVTDLFVFRERAIGRIKLAHASPKASARLVLWLPVLTLVMAQLVGWDVLSSITQRPITLLSIGFGLGLLLLARWITTKMLVKASPKESFIGFYLMAVALEISGGANMDQARSRALKIYLEVFFEEPGAKELQSLREVIALVEQTGVRSVELLRRQAENLQREVLLEAELKIEKLGTKLMLPLGLGVLPAFVFLAVVPLMVTTLGSK